MYKDYNENEIKRYLNDYKYTIQKTPDLFEKSNISINSENYNIETFIKLYNDECSKLPYEEFVRKLIKLRYSGLIDDYSISIIDKLLSDQKYYKKIKFCNDGSFRNNRIWGRILNHKYTLGPDINYELWKKFGEKYPFNIKNPEETIDWIYNNFNTIFLQIYIM